MTFARMNPAHPRPSHWITLAGILTLIPSLTPTTAAPELSAWTIPTFECLGLYVPSPTDQGPCQVRYRSDDNAPWREALPLVYDELDHQYRGSLVGLTPDTAYSIELQCGDRTVTCSGRTQTESLPVGQITQSFTFVATASTSKGPLYVFRNVFGRSRISHQDPSGGTLFKTAGVDRRLTVDDQEIFGDRGRRYFFHNTALQPHGALDVFSGHGVCNAIVRNNLLHVRGRTFPSSVPGAPPNDFRNNLTGGYLGGGFVQAMFVPSEHPEWFLAPEVPTIQWGKVTFTRDGREFNVTDPVVQSRNPALDTGARIPGFNDDYQGSAPDIGAFENGNPPLRFGRRAAPNYRPAPWESL